MASLHLRAVVLRQCDGMAWRKKTDPFPHLRTFEDLLGKKWDLFMRLPGVLNVSPLNLCGKRGAPHILLKHISVENCQIQYFDCDL